MNIQYIIWAFIYVINVVVSANTEVRNFFYPTKSYPLTLQPNVSIIYSIPDQVKQVEIDYDVSYVVLPLVQKRGEFYQTVLSWSANNPTEIILKPCNYTQAVCFDLIAKPETVMAKGEPIPESILINIALNRLVFGLIPSNLVPVILWAAVCAIPCGYIFSEWVLGYFVDSDDDDKTKKNDQKDIAEANSKPKMS